MSFVRECLQKKSHGEWGVLASFSNSFNRGVGSA